jgi:hypothetical protein
MTTTFAFPTRFVIDALFTVIDAALTESHS